MTSTFMFKDIIICTAILPCFLQLRPTPSLFARNRMPHRHVNERINSGCNAFTSYKRLVNISQVLFELQWVKKI